MCSFPTPTPETCVLLKHHQIVTLFHGKQAHEFLLVRTQSNNNFLIEMGHGIHDLLARTKYVRFHGYNTTLDFREMPSSMLENWCWMKKVLKDLSCHYTMLNDKYLIDWRKQHPGEPDPPKEIPDHLVDNLIKHRYFNRGLYHLRQLYVLS
jgi:metallopeptidase MepB